jgi:hypothetical protein
MKTAPADPQRATIVALLHDDLAAPELPTRLPTAARGAPPPDVLTRARAFAEPLLAGSCAGHRGRPARSRRWRGGHPGWHRGHGRDSGGRLPGLCGRAFGRPGRGHGQGLWRKFCPSWSITPRKLVRIQRAARAAVLEDAEASARQLERVRKMLLAFSRDLRGGAAASGFAPADPALACPDARALPGRRGPGGTPGVRAAGQSPRHLAKSSGSWKTSPSAFWSPRPITHWPERCTRSAWSANCACTRLARSW